MAEVFNSFWYGASLSPIEWLCLKSFVERGLRFHLYVYDTELAVPKGVVLKDAGEIYAEDEVFSYRRGVGKGSVSAFSNLFRYKLLYERGGWWVDMDVIYTGASLPSERSYFGWQDADTINSAILQFGDRSSIMHKCMKRAEMMGENVRWGEGGPELITQVVEEENRSDEAYSPDYAYPVAWADATAFYDPSRSEEVKGKIESSHVPFVHLWNEVLKRIGIQKSIAPPTGSYLNEEAERLGVGWPSSEVRYTSGAMRRIIDHYEASRKLRQTQAKLSAIEESRGWKSISLVRRLLGKHPI